MVYIGNQAVGLRSPRAEPGPGLWGLRAPRPVLCFCPSQAFSISPQPGQEAPAIVCGHNAEKGRVKPPQAPAGPSVLGQVAPVRPPRAWERKGLPWGPASSHPDMADPEGGQICRLSFGR